MHIFIIVNAYVHRMLLFDLMMKIILESDALQRQVSKSIYVVYNWNTIHARRMTIKLS